MKKCRRCPNPATLHITEVQDGNAVAVHLCEDCAQQYLDTDSPDVEADPALELAAKLEALVGKEETRKDMDCPSCGIKFSEFRENGRLGCPHCYQEFRDELAPLLDNVHENTIHEGKRPSRSPTQADGQNRLIRLRGLQKAAIDQENYEEAARLRDEIAQIEEETAAANEESA